MDGWMDVCVYALFCVCPCVCFLSMYVFCGVWYVIRCTAFFVLRIKTRGLEGGGLRVGFRFGFGFENGFELKDLDLGLNLGLDLVELGWLER